jgi:hypothetical protein
MTLSTDGERFTFRRQRAIDIVADVAYDSVDRPNNASSDDLDLLAHPPHDD